MFVAGDASRDAQFVVVAAAEGVKAAVAINRPCNGRSSRREPECRRQQPEPVREPPPDEPAPVVLRMPVTSAASALTILAGLAIVFALQYAQPVIIPIVLGILISYALEPIVAGLERWRVPRAVGAAMVLVAVVGVGSGLLYGLRGAGDRDRPAVAAGGGAAAADGRKRSADRATAIQQVQRAATELEKAANAAAPPPPPLRRPTGPGRVPPINISDYLMWGSIGIVAAFGQLVLILFLVYFLLASGDLYRRKLVKIVGPSLTDKKLTVQILQEIDRQIEMFLLVQVFTSAIVGVATWLAFRALGVEQAAVWGLLAGLFNSIPYFGPVIVTGGTSVVAFLQFGDHAHGGHSSAAVSLVITSLEGFLLTPWLTSRAARMNAVAIFIGLLFWGWVWNVWGMLLAVPLLMVIRRSAITSRTSRASASCSATRDEPRTDTCTTCHAALLLDVGGLQRIEQLTAQPLRRLEQHRLVDDEAIGAVGQAHAPARRTDAVSRPMFDASRANSIPSGASTRHISVDHAIEMRQVGGEVQHRAADHRVHGRRQSHGSR